MIMRNATTLLENDVKVPLVFGFCLQCGYAVHLDAE